MKGIRYVVDEAGNRSAVLIDLRSHGELWEDFLDILIAQGRSEEPVESVDEVERDLRRSGKLNGGA